MPFAVQRRFERYVVTEKILVAIHDQKTWETGTLVYASEGGCYAATTAGFQRDDLVTLLVHVPEEKGYLLGFGCKVAWHNRGQVITLPVGYGLEFLQSPATRANADKLLQALNARGALEKLAP